MVTIYMVFYSQETSSDDVVVGTYCLLDSIQLRHYHFGIPDLVPLDRDYSNYLGRDNFSLDIWTFRPSTRPALAPVPVTDSQIHRFTDYSFTPVHTP